MSEVERQNIEIKVRVSATEREQIEKRALELTASAGGVSTDIDTYFRVPHGRLKLRISNDGPEGTLIYYERPNEANSRLSHYRLVSVPDAQALRSMLALALGVLVTVKKRRHVAIYKQTRIHVDDVEQLGTFVELETVIDTQDHDDALAEHRFVFAALGLDVGEIVPGSYSDLMLQLNDGG